MGKQTRRGGGSQGPAGIDPARAGERSGLAGSSPAGTGPAQPHHNGWRPWDGRGMRPQPPPGPARNPCQAQRRGFAQQGRPGIGGGDSYLLQEAASRHGSAAGLQAGRGGAGGGGALSGPGGLGAALAGSGRPPAGRGDALSHHVHPTPPAARLYGLGPPPRAPPARSRGTARAQAQWREMMGEKTAGGGVVRVRGRSACRDGGGPERAGEQRPHSAGSRRPLKGPGGLAEVLRQKMANSCPAAGSAQPHPVAPQQFRSPRPQSSILGYRGPRQHRSLLGPPPR